MAEGTDPLARVAELLIEHGRFDIKGCRCGWAELGKSHARHVAGVLAAAGLLRDQPRPIRRPSDYRVVWDDGEIDTAHSLDDAYLLRDGAETSTGRIEQRDVFEYREVGPWRPVEDEGNADD